MITVELSGSIQADPASPLDQTSPLSASLELAFKQNYAAAFGANMPISGTFIPALGTITKVRAIAVRAIDGQSLVVKLTSVAGTDQALPVSGLLVLQAQNAGDEYTAIKVVGSGRIEYLLAGDVT